MIAKLWRREGISSRPTRAAIFFIATALILACGKAGNGPVVESPPPPPPPAPPPPPPPSPGPVDATVSVDTAAKFQTMSGWEATAQSGQESPGFSGWQMPLFDLAVSDLGINRLRLAVKSGAENPVDNYALYRAGQVDWNSVRYATVNDNNDPNLIDPAGFHFTELDQLVELVVLPIRQRLAARGERLYVNLNYVSFNGGGLVHGSAAEYGEFLLAAFQHLRDRYNLVPDAVEVILEPDNGTIWTSGTLVGQRLKAAGDRLAAAGFNPEFIGPSVTNMANTLLYLDAMVQVPGVLTYLKEVAYHRYGGVSDANLAAIKARASQYGLRTSMLEHIGSGVDDLYKDLTVAGVSSWQQYTLAFPTSDNGAQYYVISNGAPVMGSRTPALRQYFRYVRLGATRVGASSDNTALVQPVAFTNVGGAPVVVLHASQAGTFAISGLRPGTYGITTSNAGTPALADATAAANGSLAFVTPVNGIITVYLKP